MKRWRETLLLTLGWWMPALVLALILLIGWLIKL